jgi:hypothetical protein
MNWPHYKAKFGTEVLFAVLFWALFLFSILPNPSWADKPISCTPEPPYNAPQYVEPINEPEVSKLQLIDNKDGTITDPDSGLLWTQKDSYADLGKCLTWQESMDYVEKLDTANFSDWRMPTIQELSTLYDPSKENNMAWDHHPEYPLALDEKFSDGAAYWLWSSDCSIVEGKRCCAKTLYFVKGFIHVRNLDQCNNGGVRAVRNLK